MNWIIKFFAHFFSIVFHPLLMLTYMLIILLAVNPYLFGPTITSNKDVWVLILFFSTFLIPAFSVFMMKALGMVDSIDLKKRQLLCLRIFLGFHPKSSLANSLVTSLPLDA